MCGSKRGRCLASLRHLIWSHLALTPAGVISELPCKDWGACSTSSWDIWLRVLLSPFFNRAATNHKVREQVRLELSFVNSDLQMLKEELEALNISVGVYQSTE